MTSHLEQQFADLWLNLSPDDGKDGLASSTTKKPKVGDRVKPNNHQHRTGTQKKRQRLPPAFVPRRSKGDKTGNGFIEIVSNRSNNTAEDINNEGIEYDC